MRPTKNRTLATVCDLALVCGVSVMLLPTSITRLEDAYRNSILMVCFVVVLTVRTERSRARMTRVDRFAEWAIFVFGVCFVALGVFEMGGDEWHEGVVIAGGLVLIATALWRLLSARRRATEQAV
jgi:hypothetical protein